MVRSSTRRSDERAGRRSSSSLSRASGPNNWRAGRLLCRPVLWAGGGLPEASRLLDTANQIHVLDRGSRGPLDQVIDRAQTDGPACAVVVPDADMTGIGSGNKSDLGQRFLQHVYEWG